VEYEASELNAELNKVFDSISERAKIPGFRKGHVPRKTIEMRFGKKAIHDEVIENLLNESIPGIMKDYDIEPLFPPSLKSRGAIIEGQPVSVNLLVEARPEINLPEFEDIEVERLISVVDDAMIDDMIDRLRKSQAKFEVINTPVQEDSFVSVEFSTVAMDGDGKEVSHSVKAEMATLNMQELPAEEFKETLMGKNVGEFAVVTIKDKIVGDNIESISTSTRYDLRIVEVGKRILPELTPEFFRVCMGFDCPTEEDFRVAISERMLTKLQNDSQASAEARAVSIVAEKAGFEVPPSLVYHEKEKIKAFDEKDAKERYKIELKELLKLRKIEYEDYERQIITRAWRIIRDSLVLDEMKRKHEINVEPSDLEEWIKDTAEKDNVDSELLKKEYFKDKDSVNLLVDRVFADKAIRLLMSKVKIVDVMELTQPVAMEAENTEDTETSETEKTEQ
jgi:trigger factor